MDVPGNWWKIVRRLASWKRRPGPWKTVRIPGLGLVYELDDRLTFPDPELAGDGGVLAVGGDLSPARLLEAYREGIFPWYSDDEPILWWSPAVRMVFEPAAFRPSRSMRAVLRKGTFEVRCDTAFTEVIRACAEIPRKDQAGTWIGPDVQSAYTALHELGHCHSIEAWHQGALAGGFYGLCLGSCFFGESMFSRQTDASKAALATLAANAETLNLDLIDCQLPNEHLLSLGAKEISRTEFLQRLERSLSRPRHPGKWSALTPFAQLGPR
jgi:leucyl/phenylalanyl-tRNA--protein transferase